MQKYNIGCYKDLFYNFSMLSIHLEKKTVNLPTIDGLWLNKLLKMTLLITHLNNYITAKFRNQHQES